MTVEPDSKLTKLHPKTLIELEDDDNLRSLELAAARAEVRVIALLHRAFEASDISQKELAQRVGVTEGRVSQVMRSEGNLRVTTVARYLRALGYRFNLTAVPVDRSVKPLREFTS